MTLGIDYLLKFIGKTMVSSGLDMTSWSHGIGSTKPDEPRRSSGAQSQKPKGLGCMEVLVGNPGKP